MSSPMMRDGFSEFMYPGLNEAYLLAFNSYPAEYQKFLNIESSSKMDEDDAATAGFGLIPEKSEGDSPIYDAMEYIDKKTYTHKTYAMGFEVTEEAYEDELYGILKQAPRALAVSVKQTIDTLAADVLNSSFSSSTKLGIDGKVLCATDHPKQKDSGTVANRPTVDCDFDPTALYSCLETWESWENDNGLPLLIRPSKLLSGPAQRKIFAHTLGTDKEPYTSDNEINAVREWELSKEILHYLSDPDAWWLISNAADHFMKWFWRVRPQFRNFDDPNTGNAKYMVRFRCSYGFTHWWGVYGSPGT